MNNREREDNRQLWKLKTSEFMESGMTQKEWCECNDTKISSLRYWLRQFREYDSTEQTPKWLKVSLDENSSVANLAISEPDKVTEFERSAASKYMYVHFGNLSIDIPVDISMAQLSQLLTVIRSL